MIHWLLLSLFSALFLGGYEVSRKAALADNAPLLVLLTASAFGWLSLASVLLVADGTAWAQQAGLSLHPLAPIEHLAIAAKAALVSLSWVFAYVAVKHLPITVAGPLRAVSPALTGLGALVLIGESPSPRQWCGIAIIFAGYLAFARVGRMEGISFIKSKWIWLLVLGTLVGAMSGLYDKYLLQRVELQPTTLQFWFLAYATVLQGMISLFFLFPMRETRHGYRFVWTAPLAGVFLVLADQFYFHALAQQEALVSVVSLVRRSSVIVSFSLGSLIFRERFVKNKAGALLIVLLGLAVLLSWH